MLYFGEKMKKLMFFICLCLLTVSLCTSCVQNEREEAKKTLQTFLEFVVNGDTASAAVYMPFINTLDVQQKDALLSFFKEIASVNYVLSVPDQKGSRYTVTLSIQGESNSTVHYSFVITNKNEEGWIISENVTQKITYDSFTAQ